MNYDPKNIEKKWQDKWEKDNIYHAPNHVEGKENFYTLAEFSYPSGNLHVGHWYAFALPDVYARFKRMQGYNVLYPTGFDAFGLPAENAAIKRGEDPKKWTWEHMDHMRTQLKTLGASFDWDREAITADPSYYKWTQWMFNQFFKNDMVYRAPTKVNWCEFDKTILANEQVHGGQCERCGSDVVQKDMSQWMLRITEFADDLHDDLEDLAWDNSIKQAQREWIGRKEGSEIPFVISAATTRTVLGEPDSDAKERPVVKVILRNKKGEILVMQSTDGGWDLPGGGIDDGESIEQAAIRELQEETEYTNFKFVKHIAQSDNYHYSGRDASNMKSVVDVVLCELIDEEESVKNTGPDESKTSEVWIEPVQAYKDFQDNPVYLNFPKKWVGQYLHSEVRVFTTRPDTLFGVTYMVLAPEHHLVEMLKDSITNWEEVQEYLDMVSKKSDLDRQQSREKTGVQLKGVTAINPANNEQIPVWIADYVLAHFGTGAVMAVPAHDERDFEFATKFKLPIKKVIDGEVELPATDHGQLISSDEFNGLDSEEAKVKITEAVGGEIKKTYRLRDWGVSRQRYWGCPIPVVYDPEGKPHPVPDEHLPWILPEDIDHTPDGTSPLARSDELKKRTEEIFGAGWTPEVDTMDTFVDSTWYFYRYLDNNNQDEFASAEAIKSWMPIDIYFGGAEHTTMHLLYSRYWVKALHKLGLVPHNEPYKVRNNRGLILGPDGNKMSKSKGNVIDPDEVVQRLGADTVRLYLAFIGPFNEPGNYPWDPNGVVGVRRFIERVWRLQEKVNSNETPVELQKLLHKTIQKCTRDTAALKFNTVISAMMVFVNDAEKAESINKQDYLSLLQLLAPLAPHVTEELWETNGGEGSIHISSWPECNTALCVDETVTLGVQVNGKLRAEIILAPDAPAEAVQSQVLELSEVQKWTEGKELKKFVYVPGRIINVVV